MPVKKMARVLTPELYKWAVTARRSPSTKRILRYREYRRAKALFDEESLLTVEISESVGMGGILRNAANAVLLGERHGTEIALRFTSPTYAPAGGEGDWLEQYFDRLGPRPDDSPVCQEQDVWPRPDPMVGRVQAEALWGALRIVDGIRADAGVHAPTGNYAAVHFRGSDKFLEAARVRPDGVLDRIADEMRRRGLDQVFVASDEPSFVESARRRFGSGMVDLPLEAVADPTGVPAHFRAVDGRVKAREALVTMLVLAGADVLVKTPSLLSDWAATLARYQDVVLIG